MEKMFKDVKLFKLILETKVYATEPILEEKAVGYVHSPVFHEGRTYQIPYDGSVGKHYAHAEELKTDTVLEKISQVHEFSHVLCDFNGFSLLRILGYGTMKKAFVKHQMASDLGEQTFSFSRESFDPKTGVFTIVLRSEDKAYRRTPAYEEKEKEIMEFGWMLAGKANENLKRYRESLRHAPPITSYEQKEEKKKWKLFG